MFISDLNGILCYEPGISPIDLDSGLVQQVLDALCQPCYDPGLALVKALEGQRCISCTRYRTAGHFLCDQRG